MNNKEIQTKLVRGLLEPVTLRLLNEQPMCGYQLIVTIRKVFNTYFGPSTIYPLLNALEKKGYVKSEWVMNGERPRKVYELTATGQNLLSFTESSLNFIVRRIRTEQIMEVRV
jgi:PadR family transcriptional regulator PadR